MKCMNKALVACCLCVVVFGCESRRGGEGGATGLQRPSARAGIEQNGPHFERANQALIDQMPEHAIEICKQGIEAGESACYRLVGIAYKQKGEHAQACDYFSQARASNDPHSLTIERYEKHLKCASRLR